MSIFDKITSVNNKQNVYNILITKFFNKKDLDYFLINYNKDFLPEWVKTILEYLLFKQEILGRLPNISEATLDMPNLSDIFDEDEAENFANDFILDKLKKDYKKNKLINALDDFALNIDEESVDKACDVFRQELNIIDQVNNQRASTISLLSDCDKVLDFEPETGFPYGLPSLDKNIGGIKRGEYIGIVARPKGNKSFLSRFLALNLLRSGADIFYIGLETSKKNELRNFISLASNVNPFNMAQKIFTQNERERVNGVIRSMQDIKKTQIFEIMDATCFNKMTPSCIFSTIEPMIKNKDKTFIFIDQASWLIDDEGANNPNQSLTNISKAIIGYVQKSQIPCIVLFQANREAGSRVIPSARDIQWSDRPLQDCHVILGLGATMEMKRANQKYIKTIAQRIGTDTCVLTEFNIAEGIFQEIDGNIIDPDEAGDKSERI